MKALKIIISILELTMLVVLYDILDSVGLVFLSWQWFATVVIIAFIMSAEWAIAKFWD